MSGRKRLVLADPLADEGLDILHSTGGLEVEDYSECSRADLKRGLTGAAGLIVRSRTRADTELLDSADALEVIGRAGVGLDNIDVATATRRGIAVLNAPGGNAVSTAELAFGLLLAAARSIPEADRSIREGRWNRKAFRGTQLAGKTLGVIGAGRIGTEVIVRSRAFGVRVLVTDPYLTEQRARDLGVELVPLDILLARADFVTLHVPLTPETEGMIGASQLARMKPSCILVNAARGGVVDESALADALHTGRLAGAALDVFAVEPLPENHPLRTAPGLVMTPHLGAATPDAQREVSVEIALSVRDALLEGDYRSAVNVPGIGPSDRRSFDPILDLARRLGAILSVIVGGGTGRVSLRYGGGFERALEVIAAAALEGYLSRTLAGPLNIINALVLARERGIEVSRSRQRKVTGYRASVELSAMSGHGKHFVSGVLDDDDRPRLLRIGAFHVDVTPRGTLLLVHHDDVPGVIGQVGTRLGSSGVNIAEFHQARDRDTGEALAVLALDDPLGRKLLSELRALPAVTRVRQVRLEG